MPDIDTATLLKDYTPTAQYEAMLESFDATATERDEYLANHEKSAARVKELEAKVRGRAYKDAFTKIAKEAKVPDADHDDVWDLLKLSQDADEPDARMIKLTLDDFLAKRPDRYREKTAEETRAKEFTPSSEASRGRSTNPAEPVFTVTRAQCGNAMFMRDNQAAMARHHKAGTLRVDEQR